MNGPYYKETRAYRGAHSTEPSVAQLLRNGEQNRNDLLRLEHMADHFAKTVMLTVSKSSGNVPRVCTATPVCCSVRTATPVCCKCVAVCCSVLQCVAVCCSVLQCVAVCCSVLMSHISAPLHQCVASVLQCVAVCCSV